MSQLPPSGSYNDFLKDDHVQEEEAIYSMPAPPQYDFQDFQQPMPVGTAGLQPTVYYIQVSIIHALLFV